MMGMQHVFKFKIVDTKKIGPLQQYQSGSS